MTRFLTGQDVEVVEVDRPNRQTRRKKGKSDPTDAFSAARAALSGEASVIPKTRDGAEEQIRVLLVARRSAREQRIQSLTQLRHVVFCAPETIRTRFKDRYKTGVVKEAAAMRPRHSSDPLSYTTNLVIRNLARRVRRLNEEIAEIDEMLADLIHQTAPSLLELHGVGIDSAASLLVAAGDNPDRIRSEGSWARLCGVAPLPANSGKINTRYRLNRGGDRQANAALYRIVLTRMSNHPDTRRPRQTTTKRRTQQRTDHPLSETLRRPPDLQTPTPTNLKVWVGYDPNNPADAPPWVLSS